MILLIELMFLYTTLFFSFQFGKLLALTNLRLWQLCLFLLVIKFAFYSYGL